MSNQRKYIISPCPMQKLKSKYDCDLVENFISTITQFLVIFTDKYNKILFYPFKREKPMIIEFLKCHCGC